jgi:phytoene dehydrogenase-like protein
MRDAIIIGGGHNGLVAAAFLARAGLKPLVLERRDRVGGCADTTELAPGFLCPTLAHTAAIDPSIVRALGLERHGLHIIRPATDACAPTRDGRALILGRDAARTAESVAAFSRRDAERYPQFLTSVGRISGVLRAINNAAPPSIDDPTAADVLEMLRAGSKFRGLGKADAHRLLRWMPMAVADLAGEWFESEPLRATVAAGGIVGSFLGPWSAGSAAVLLLLGAGEGHPIATGWFATGGTGAVAEALADAARAAGAEIRTGAEVAHVVVAHESTFAKGANGSGAAGRATGGSRQANRTHGADAAATGVVLASGEEIPARVVVSGVDPKRTLLGLVDPMHLAPELVRRAQNIRTHGTLAKVNYAVSSLPRFSGIAGLEPGEQTAALSGRIRLNPEVDAIERAFDAAKYGAVSEDPWMELTIPSIADPSLAKPGQHVVSAYLQYAPYTLRGTTWDAERDRLGEIATRTIASYAPAFGESIVAQQVITPLDLERTYGLTGGHIFHGELALDQFFVTRPLLGWARYATPIRGLFLCGSGTHPGTGINGRSGALAAKEIARQFRR